MDEDRDEQLGLTPKEPGERSSPTSGLTFEEALQRVVLGGPDTQDAQAAWQELAGSEGAWAPLSPKERRQLEERGRQRLADPEYRRRLEATDRVIDSLRKEMGR